VEGVRKAIYFKGKIVGYETERSDQLLMFLLKAYDRPRFGDKRETTLRVERWEDLPPEAQEKILADLRAKALQGFDGDEGKLAEFELQSLIAAGHQVIDVEPGLVPIFETTG